VTASGSGGSEVAILVTVALTTMLAPLNSTMIGVALPEIMEQFVIDLGSGSWLVIAYLITMAALQPVGGKLGDRLGRRPMILAGLVYFAVASLGAALSTSEGQLLFFRIQQGIAGAIALPNGTALFREIIP
jgi:MFS family permease